MDDIDASFDRAFDGDDVPPLRRPEDMPPVRTQADLHRTWRALMGELGFSRPMLWLLFLDDEGRFPGSITRVEDLPDRPDPRLLASLMEVCTGVFEHGLGSRVAFLRSRPGSRRVTDADRAWARGLLSAAHRAGVPCAPVHLATDEAVLLLAADDLAGRQLPDSA